MRLVIELEQEVDGRWIADVPQLGVLVYGDTKTAAVESAQSAAREIIADRVSRGELPSDR